MKQDNIIKITNLITEFIQVMKENILEKDLSLMFNNFNTLKIKFKNYKITNILSLSDTYGGYNPLKNTLILDINDFESTIDHELFHVSSSLNYLNRLLISGFHQTILKNKKVIESIGIGINEGYTQYLAEKYFSNKRNIMSAYRYQVAIVKLVEEIVGANKMQSFYFNADLFALINELSYYNDKGKVIEFIKSLDFLHKKLSNPNYKGNNQRITINTFRKVHIFLIETYLYKLQEEIDLGNIDEDQFNIKASTFIEQIPSAVESKKVLYNDIITVDLIKDTLNRLDKEPEKVKRK